MHEVSLTVESKDTSLHNECGLSPLQAHAPKAAKHDPAAQSAVAPNKIAADAEWITPAMLTLVELDQEQIDTVVRSVPGGARNIQDIYPLSPLQEGILFHHLFNTQNDTYVLSTVFELQSRTQIDALTNAVQKVMDRHDILRSAVLWEGLPQPVQVVYRNVKLPIEDLTLDGHRDPVDELWEHMKGWRRRMDLKKAPLLRLELASSPHDERCYAVLQVHHLACDHQSLRVVVAEALACLDGREHSLPRPVAFRDYVAQALASVRIQEAETFFRNKLGTIEEPTAPFGLLDVHGDGSQLEEARQMIDRTLAQAVRNQARRFGVSAARVFHAAWGVVVARTSGIDQVVYGTVLLAAQQRSAQAQLMLGLSVNTLPLRLQLHGVTAQGLVEQTDRELAELLNHETAPLTLAQRCSGVIGTSPLFTSALNFRRSAPQDESVCAAGVRVIARGEAWTNYPVTLTIDDSGEGFELIAKADRRVGPNRIIDYLCTALQSLLDALERAPQTPALSLSILPDAERRQVVELFNATHANFPKDKLIHEMFEAQAQRTPQSLAVVYEGRSLTYEDLNGRANQLGRFLRTKRVGPDRLVALCVDRGLEMVVGLLGILKAGGAYLPLDPDYPAARQAQILQDAAPVVVLTQQKLRAGLPATSAEMITLDGDWDAIAKWDSTNLDTRQWGLRSSHLAYVIYTSGSTGKPKGVMVEHRNVASLWQGLEHIYIQSGPCQRVAVNASFAFDASVKQFVQLLSGRTIVLIPQEYRWDSELLLRFIDKHKVDAIDCTPSQLKSWLSSGLLERTNGYPLRLVLIGGEPIDPELWNRLSRNAETAFYNVYGPTESTVDTTFSRLERDATAPHIGRPMENRRVYILDRDNQPVPIGVAGEICISGPGVARGYLNRPDLTREAFVPDPFSSEPQARMYKTGDQGRWQADGSIEYLGRNDLQVKIRGFRIELGEIEAQLASCEGVEQGVVIAREDVPGEKRLVAYVVLRSNSTSAPTLESLRGHLKEKLPEYMVPSVVVILERMPLTPNGKLDRRALPPPELETQVSRRYEPPQGELEEIVAGIWKALLRVERVGRQDNFFELGGHSLLIVQMLERLRRIGLSTEVHHIFESPTLVDLARVLTRESLDKLKVAPNLIPAGCGAITPEMLTLVELEPEHIKHIEQTVPGGATNIQDIYPLAPLQEGILFHHLLSEKSGDVYVVPTLLRVSSRERLDDLICALQRVIERHDVLRTAVLWEQLPRPVQVVYRRATLPVQEVALDSRLDQAEQVKEWMRPDRQKLDLRQAPPMRLQIAVDHRGFWYALLQLHHIVQDATSQDIVFAEVVAYLEGRGQQLLQSSPYRDHVSQALAYANTRDAEAFFRQKLSDVTEPTTPLGLLNVHGDGSRIEQTRQPLELTLARRLRSQAGRLGVSAATIFHAAWSLVVASTSGRDDVVFGTVLLGRLQGTIGAERVLGMFINTLPLRLRLKGMIAKELVEQTQRELVELLNHEQASLAVAQRCSGISGSTPLFSALLNYRHAARMPDAELIRAAGIQLLARHGLTNYPITLSVDDHGEGFSLTAQTDQRIDPRRITGYLQAAMLTLVEALEQEHQRPVLTLPILPDNESRSVIERFNATRAAYPPEKFIHEMFEAQTERTPDAVAVLHEGQRLTYCELNRKSNQLAQHLRSNGIGPGCLVGICAERSPRMVIGLLGILKAGGAYVPFDPNYPTERLQYMLEDAAPQVVLTQRDLRGGLPNTTAEIIELDSDLKGVRDDHPQNLSPDELGLASSNLLYVIYTSGSTGRPKGTTMPHSAMVNLIEWHRQNLPIEGRRVLQFAALSFDVAFQEIFSTLCLGGTLVLLDEWIRKDVRALIELLNNESVERLFVPPLMLQSLAECFKSVNAAPRTLKDVITAGEQLHVSREIVELFKQMDGCRLHNHYGPTETHVVTALTLAGNPEEWPAFPLIGKPISNTQIYVLSTHGQPVPIGAIGEIYIGGESVARGYLNRPDLTTERFVADPFSVERNARLYKTGDLGRWREDGTLEYLGRNDDQVKVRGYRVELKEIEAQLLQHERVKGAAVIARDDVPGEKRLVAYVAPCDGSVLSTDELRAHLQAGLPEHMVPSAFVILDGLPLTPNGKLDRRALPAPEVGAYASQEYEAPQGEIEEAVAQIWQKLLRVERVGRQDNFFNLGGHSLLATRVITHISHVLEVDLPVRVIFEKPTVEELSDYILEEMSAEVSMETP